ncbi:hypothetical protein OROGR_021101 [Orobanche gracilis]
MAARAATLRLPTLLSLGDRFRSSSCFMGFNRFREKNLLFENRAAEVPRGTRIYGAPLKQRKHLPSYPESCRTLPKDYERCVSKVWESKCSTALQHFTANFSPKPKHKRDIMLHHIDVDYNLYFTTYSLDEDGTLVRKYDIYPPAAVDGNFLIACRCNGLILFRNLKNELLLWNPTTNQFKILPQPYVKLPGVEHLYIDFAMSSDHGSEDYKVFVIVMVSEIDEEDEEAHPISMSHDIALYSLRDNSWKIMPLLEDYGTSGVCFEGNYYSIAYMEDDSQCILSFNFATATFSRIPLPNMSESDDCDVVEYNGRLGVVVYSNDEVERSYGLWVMSDDGSWSKETVFHTFGVRWLDCFSEKGELVYFQNFRDESLVFDRATGKLKTLGCYSNNGCIRLVPFYESFVQLKEQEQEQAQVREEEEEEEEGFGEVPLVYA